HALSRSLHSFPTRRSSDLGLDHEGVQVLEVRDELRVPGLDEPAGREVLRPADVRPEKVRLETRMELRQRVRLVGHVRELRLVLRMLLDIRGEHGLAAVVPVARPVEYLEAPALLRYLCTGRFGQARATSNQA